MPDNSLQHSLLAVADLCNQGLSAVFTKDAVHILDKSAPVSAAIATLAQHTLFVGTKGPTDRLWPIDLPLHEQHVSLSEDPIASPQANLAITNSSDADYALYTSLTFGAPTNHALLKALGNGYLGNWPRATPTMIRKNLPNHIAMHKGHLSRTRQGLHSTAVDPTNVAPAITPPAGASVTDESPDSQPDVFRADEYNHVYVQMHRLEAIPNVSSADATGLLPLASSSGNRCILIFEWNGYVHAEPLAGESSRCYVEAYRRAFAAFRARDISIALHMLDNKSSAELEAFMVDEAKVPYQYVPAGNHRALQAERAIQDFKHHLIATICACDPDFPVSEWDRLLPQVILTLNHLRAFLPNPKISAWEGMYGSKYDFGAHPIAPCGTRVLIFESPEQRASWAAHGVDGFYLGPAVDHYRNFRVWCRTTRRERITDTVAWLPKAFMMPGSSASELITAAITDLTAALQRASDSPVNAAERTALAEASLTAVSALRTVAEFYSGVEASAPRRRLADLDAPGFPTPATPAERNAATTTADILLSLGKHAPPSAVAPSQPQSAPVPHTTLRVPPTVAPSQRVPPVIAPRQRVIPPVAPAQTGAPPIPPGVQRVPPGPVHLFGARDTPLGPALRVAQPNSVLPPPGPAQQPSCPTPAPIARLTRSATRTGAHAAVAQSNDRCRAQRTQSPMESDAPAFAHNAFGGKAKGSCPPHSADHAGSRTQRRHAAFLRGADNPACAFSGSGEPLAPLNLDEFGHPLKMRAALLGPDKDEWLAARVREYERLFETNTARVIARSDQPADRRKDTSYYNEQCKEKRDPHTQVKTFRVRGTFGGDRLSHPGETAARTAALDVIKTHIHSVVSDGADFMNLDLTDFYLMTPLLRPEYFRVSVAQVPEAIMSKYSLTPFIDNGHLLFEVTKGMYGLPQAGFLAQQRLIQHLTAHGYIQAADVPCLFRHETRPISFTLVVDDFGIKYKDKDDVRHLMAALTELYKFTFDWEGRLYLGFTLKFDKVRRTVSLSMPDYIRKLLIRFKGMFDGASAYTPAEAPDKHYGARQQWAQTPDDSPTLSAADITTLQEFIGCFLYYARALDYTMLPAVTALASDQSHPTQAVWAAAQRLLAYAAAYPDNELVFTACDMILYIQSDASYHSRSRGRSVAGGIHYLGNRDSPYQINGAIHAFSCIIPVVVASAAEAEYAGLFLNAQQGEWERTVLEALGYPQPPTLIMGDNTTATGIANDTCKIKRTKSIDMRFHWIRDRIRQGHFAVAWREGENNLADFFTKPLPRAAHQALMPLIVRVPARVSHTARSRHAL